MTTQFTWSVRRSLRVILDDGTNQYTYGLGLIGMIAPGGVISYFLPDGLGSTANITDASGAVTATYAYDVFGAIRTQTGSSANPFLFPGEQKDNESGYSYLRARYYDPATGRFVSRDPLHMGNEYSYVGNNPVNRVDPTGRCGCEPMLSPPDDPGSGIYPQDFPDSPADGSGAGDPGDLGAGPDPSAGDAGDSAGSAGDGAGLADGTSADGDPGFPDGASGESGPLDSGPIEGASSENCSDCWACCGPPAPADGTDGGGDLTQTLNNISLGLSVGAAVVQDVVTVSGCFFGVFGCAGGFVAGIAASQPLQNASTLVSAVATAYGCVDGGSCASNIGLTVIGLIDPEANSGVYISAISACSGGGDVSFLGVSLC